MKNTIIALALAGLSFSTLAAQVSEWEDIDPNTIRFGYISSCLGQPKGYYEVEVPHDEHCWPVQYFPKNATPSSMRNVRDFHSGTVINYFDAPNTRIILR